jgi:GNAT superfamily N-acetyltransferase
MDARSAPEQARPATLSSVITIAVRTARREDLDDLTEIFRSASLSNEGDREHLLAHPEFLEEFLELGDRAIVEGRVRLASIDGRTVGFATSARDGSDVEVEDLFVHPDWTRRGVATLLIADIVDSSRATGASTLVVTANPHAMAFYVSVGFGGSEVVATEFGSGTRMYRPLR